MILKRDPCNADDYPRLAIDYGWLCVESRAMACGRFAKNPRRLTANPFCQPPCHQVINALGPQLTYSVEARQKATGRTVSLKPLSPFA